jgi:hypothetical protein
MCRYKVSCNFLKYMRSCAIHGGSKAVHMISIMIVRALVMVLTALDNGSHSSHKALAEHCVAARLDSWTTQTLHWLRM